MSLSTGMSYRTRAIAVLLCGVSVGPRAAASDERHVVVLMPRSLPSKPWPEGTQSTIAELAAGDYQVVVESSAAASIDELRAELRARGSEPSAAGALAILRQGRTGFAYVWAQRDAEVIELRANVDEGAVSEGAFALRVTEIIRTRDLPIPLGKSSPKPAITDESVTPAEPPVSTRAGPLLWIGGGPIFTSVGESPLLTMSVGVNVPLFSSWRLDGTAGFSLVPLRIETRAGQLDVSARTFTGHLSSEVSSLGSLSFALGAGGGLVWLDERSEPSAGFDGTSDSTAVGVLSLRALAHLQTQSLSFVFTAEPGVLVPPVSIRADEREVARLGRPWVLLGLGLGWSP